MKLEQRPTLDDTHALKMPRQGVSFLNDMLCLGGSSLVEVVSIDWEEAVIQSRARNAAAFAPLSMALPNSVSLSKATKSSRK